MIDCIDALISAATPGPWESTNPIAIEHWDSDVLTSKHFPGQEQDVVCEHSGSDSEFIAHMRQLAPLMLAEISRSRSTHSHADGCSCGLCAVRQATDAYCAERLPK